MAKALLKNVQKHNERYTCTMTQVQYHGRIRHSIQMIGPTSDIKYLDIGCGTGWSIEYVAQYSTNFVVGLDSNHQTIMELSKRQKKYLLVIGSATRLPFTPGVFQLITCWEVLEHININQEMCVLDEIYRCLANSGRMLLSTPSWNIINNIMDPAWYFGHRHYVRGELQRLCEKARLVEIKTDIRGHLWDLVATLIFYLERHVLRNGRTYHRVLDTYRDQEYKNGGGIATLFGVFVKKPFSD